MKKMKLPGMWSNDEQTFEGASEEATEYAKTLEYLPPSEEEEEDNIRGRPR